MSVVMPKKEYLYDVRLWEAKNRSSAKSDSGCTSKERFDRKYVYI